MNLGIGVLELLVYSEGCGVSLLW